MSQPVRVNFVDEGPREAPAVVFAHAVGTSLAMWAPQSAALSGEFRVIRYDHRGHGASPVPPGPYRIEDLGRDLVGLLDLLDLERASVCGLSLGAMVGLWIAEHEPARVDRLVGCCVVARPASPQAWADRAAKVRRDGIAAIADLVVERWGYTGRDARIERIVREALLATPAEGYAACCDAIERLDLEPDLARVRAPTLLVAGDDDPAAPAAEADRLAAAIPGARVRIVQGAAHLANIERPGEVTAAIAEHLGPILTEARA